MRSPRNKSAWSKMLTIMFVCLLNVIYLVSGASLPLSHGHYKPSLSELTVPFRENPKIILTHFPGQSVVIPLLSGQSSASNYLVHVARQAGHSDPGHFYVQAPHGYGVMAVIQRLHLRRISDDKSLLHLVNNCEDYIEFEGQNGEKTIPICGSLEKHDDSFYPPNLHGPKFFNSNNGRMKVTFRNHYSYGGNDILASNDSHVSDNQETITAEIAFTAFSRCDASTKDRFHCTHDKCIDATLKCDKIEQCAPGENEGVVGHDERNCTRKLPTVATSEASVDDDFLSLFGSGEAIGIGDEEEDDPSQVIVIPAEDSSAEEDFDSKLPNMTTICALVLILCTITVCGYFWGWLSQLCCAARSLVRSAGSSTTSSQHSVCTAPVGAGQQHQPRRRSLDGGSTPYYVPAVVLRPMGGSSEGPNFSKTYLKEDYPPAYDVLFPKDFPDQNQDSKL